MVVRPKLEWGELVVPLLVPAKNAALTEDILKEFLAERLANDNIPREFKLYGNAPSTPTGNVIKYKLRKEL